MTDKLLRQGPSSGELWSGGVMVCLPEMAVGAEWFLPVCSLGARLFRRRR
jgi:hypothetical protein